MSQQITTLTFLKFDGLLAKARAFFMVPVAYAKLANVQGQTFAKVMGAGKARFDPAPDWGVYAILQVWEKESYAKAFFQNSGLMASYRKYTQEMSTLYMRSIMARGEWSELNPFEKSSALDADNARLAVITRATIKTRLLRKFWKQVPHSQDNLHDNEGLLYTKGIGEVPVIHMATFSVWRDVSSLNKFAYQNKAHAKSIQMTRELDWYSEELFSRFQPYEQQGLWEGKNFLTS